MPATPDGNCCCQRYGVRSRAAQVVEIYCDRCSISNPGRTDCGIVIPNCSKYLVTWATVAIKLRSCTLCVSRSFWLARVTRSLVTRAMPSCSLLGTASKSAPRSNQRNQKISCAWGSQQVDCWTHQARWQEGADKLAKRAALKCLSFENVFSTGVVDAPADNRSAGKTAPNPVNSVLGECL